MNIQTYLRRIEYTQVIKPDVDTLCRLQLAHLRSIPFENLDIGLKRIIRIDESSIWDKLIICQRGGFCYELNGMFAWLSKQAGFEVTYLNARDYHEADDTFGIDFDHLVLMVRIPNESTRWLVDVGWGDTFTQPLDIDNPEWQEQGERAYRLEPFRDGYQLWQRGYDGKIERQYYFDLKPHQFPAEYEAACLYHQTSPQSIFTHNRIISRLTENGRISLDNDHLIVTTHGQRKEFPIQNESEFHSLLKKHFGITLQENTI
jgi:N-hydroxyarylamine O-acetyltransferase